MRKFSVFCATVFIPTRSKSRVTRLMGHDIKTSKCERRKVSGSKHGNFSFNNTVSFLRIEHGITSNFAY